MIGVASILRQHGRSALITQTVPASEMRAQSAPHLSTIADAIVTRNYSTEGFGLDRRIRVIKMRGSGHEPNPYALDIESGGLNVTKLTEDQ
jgi:circadian clock protein KaiC